MMTYWHDFRKLNALVVNVINILQTTNTVFDFMRPKNKPLSVSLTKVCLSNSSKRSVKAFISLQTFCPRPCQTKHSQTFCFSFSSNLQAICGYVSVSVFSICKCTFVQNIMIFLFWRFLLSGVWKYSQIGAGNFV